MWVDQEAMFDDREAMVWLWVPSKNLVTSDRLVVRGSVGLGQRGSDKNSRTAVFHAVLQNLYLALNSAISHQI